MFILAVTIGTIIVRLSTEQSYIRFFSERNEDDRKKLITQCVSINLVAFSIAFSVIMLFGKQLSFLVFDETNLPLIYVCLPLMIIFNVFLPLIFWKVINAGEKKKLVEPLPDEL